MRRSKSSFLLLFVFFYWGPLLYPLPPLPPFGCVGKKGAGFWSWDFGCADVALIVVFIVRHVISRSRRRISTGCRRREARDRSTS